MSETVLTVQVSGGSAMGTIVLEKKCLNCNGDGRIEGAKGKFQCNDCHGHGKIPTESGSAIIGLVLRNVETQDGEKLEVVA